MALQACWLRALGTLLLVAACGACATYDVRFAPAIQDNDLRGEANDIQAHVAVAWQGIQEREDVPELRFRVRVDNPGPTAFTLVPAEFELLDAALDSFGKAGNDSIPVVVEARGSATFDIAFPVRESLDDFDLSAVTLRTCLQGNRWSWSSTFERVDGHPREGPAISFGFGAVFGS